MNIIYMNYYYYLIILLLIALFVYWYTNSEQNQENFIPYFGYCGGCGYKNRGNCRNCLDCGFCINYNGYGECVPGDSSGPYFRSDCASWEYGRPTPILHPRYRRRRWPRRYLGRFNRYIY